MINVGVVFGGQSPEHEVSVITSIQAASVLDRRKYRPVPIYIAKNGEWYTGEALLDISAYGDLDELLRKAHKLRLIPSSGNQLHLQRAERRRLFGDRLRDLSVDIVFLGLHGGSGENGGLQGLLEILGVPYTGSGVLSSALSMDKARSKSFCQARGVPVVPFETIRESAWAGREEELLSHIISKFEFPLVVKPLSLGSSIGITVVNSRSELETAVEEAFRYDETVIVEFAVQNLREINCSILGTEDDALASVLEEPVSSSALLSYEEKYMRGSGAGGAKGRRGAAKTAPQSGMASLGRIIPAPVSEAETERIRELAIQIFKVLGCSGVARIDFLMDGESGDVFFNEINTIPGSFSFYLWEPSGIPFSELVDRLIELGFERHRQRVNRIRSYDVNLLSERSSSGLKGAKG